MATAGKRRVYVAMGSNLGNRRKFLRTAINNLAGVKEISKLYETEPVGYDDQGPFLNLVIRIETDLKAKELLKVCQAEERKADRQRTIKNGPRTLDLDLIWIEDEEIQEPDLQVPHPRMLERGFVMLPLSDLELPDSLAEITKTWLAKNETDGVWVTDDLRRDEPATHQIIKSKSELTELADKLREKGKSIGFVPTMGGLHKGHLSLVSASQKESDVTILSIFVNPLQFNDPKDFKSYPKDLERDMEALEDFDSLILFIPDQKEIYPEPVETPDIGELAKMLEGEMRPGHLEGVYKVVTELFEMVGKCNAYFGEKDYQQCLIISKLVEDFGFDIEIVTCPTVREADGLALSSRNILLEKSGRQLAHQISATLSKAKELIEAGEKKPQQIMEQMKEMMSKYGELDLEYAEVRDAKTLQPIDAIGAPVRILIAAKVGNIRLIDNMLAIPN